MAKKIKLTERQMKMLKENKTTPTNKVVRITEVQYNRIFGEKQLNEGKEPIDESLFNDIVADNMELLVNAIRAVTNSDSQAGLDPFLRRIGITWGDFTGFLLDLGVLTSAYVGGKQTFKVSKRLLIRYAKAIYNEFFGERYDLKTGEVIDNPQDEPVKNEGMMLGNDFEHDLEESNLPPGAENDPSAPWNRDDEPRRSADSIFQEVATVNDGIYTLLFLKDDTQDLYVSIFTPESTGFEEFCGSHTNSHCVIEKLNHMAMNGELDNIEDTDLIDIVDSDTVEYLMTYHADGEDTRRELESILGGMNETTTTGGVGGSFEAPMGSQTPIKRNFNTGPVGKDLDETTMSGDATGPYEQPKIWAKNKKNWRHGKKTMYPNGEIVSEALQLRRTTGVDYKGNEIPALAVVSDKEGNDAVKETKRSMGKLKKAGFIWDREGKFWFIPETELETAKSILSTLNKVEYLVDKLEDVEEMVRKASDDAQGGSKKDLLLANLEQYIEDLANATDATAMSAEIRRYLTFFANFHQYSFHNKILIYIQRPDATRVGSFKTWKERGRAVQKGSKGIAVLVPIFPPKPKNKKVTNSEEEENERPVGYRVGYVFDYSDTKAVTPDGEIPPTPKWWGDNTPSEVAEELKEHCKTFAQKEGIKITKSDAQDGEKGYSAGGHINISSDVAGVGEFSTLLHEMAHELMHWRDKSKFYAGDEIKRDRAIKELHAESVSYVVLQHYDLPATHHPTYLALWGANKEKIKENITLISNVAQYIINGIEGVAKKENKSVGVTEEMVSEMLDKIQ